MKNFIRAFALSLVATGAFAATQISATPVNTKANAIPMPFCDPNNPACTMQSN